MESEKMQIEARVVTLGNPPTTRVIAENPTAEGCNTTQLLGNLGTEQGAASQFEFPEVLKNYTPQKVMTPGWKSVI